MESNICMLRALEPEDLDILYTIENDTSLWDVGTANVPYSKYTLSNFILSAANDIYTDKQVRLVMENEQKKVVGLLDIMNFDPQHNRAEIGIVVLHDERMHGYGCRAVATAVDYCKNRLHLHQIYAIVDVHNQHSLNLFLKCGFQSGTTLQQWIRQGDEYHDARLMQLFL